MMPCALKTREESEMKIQSLLGIAKLAKSEVDAAELLLLMVEEFGKVRKLKNLGSMNEEAYMEGDHPHVSFELNQVISDDFVTMIRPEIRDGSFSIEVITNKMLDGHGLSSKDWEVVDNLEDELDLDGVETVAQVGLMAYEKSVFNHASLIEKLGIPFADAHKLAKKVWPK
jgi:hypothetical protein